MRHHKLTLVAVLLAGVAAFAVSHSFSGTINTPAVPTWVDGSGNEIAPYMNTAADLLYIDSSTGYVWTLTNLATTPTATAPFITGLWYTTANCTGTAYMAVTNQVPGRVQTTPSAGTYYAPGAAAVITTASQYFNGTCYAGYSGGDYAVAIGPVTAPTLAAAPWHLENR